MAIDDDIIKALTAPSGITDDGVDRRSWNFDEDGFARAKASVLGQAARRQATQIRTIHQDLVEMMHPVDFDVQHDGQPLDKASFAR